MDKELIQLMEDNLRQVWNEHDPATRLTTIKRIYKEDSNLYHVGHHVSGTEVINESVTKTLQSLPAGFVFTRTKPVIINNSIGRLVWGAGPAGQPRLATGMDIAHFENGKIKSLYVFLD